MDIKQLICNYLDHELFHFIKDNLEPKLSWKIFLKNQKIHAFDIIQYGDVELFIMTDTEKFPLDAKREPICLFVVERNYDAYPPYPQQIMEREYIFEEYYDQCLALACKYNKIDLMEYILSLYKCFNIRIGAALAQYGHLEILKICMENIAHGYDNLIDYAIMGRQMSTFKYLFFMGKRCSEECLFIIQKYKGYSDFLHFLVSQNALDKKSLDNIDEYIESSWFGED